MKEQETKKFDWDAERKPPEDENDLYTEGAPEYAPSEISKQPKKKKRKRRKKHYLLKLLLLIAFCVALYFFLRSSVFDIKSIKVSESSHFTAEQVEEMAGIKAGMNLFEFRGGGCEDKLEENPFIKEAKIKRSLPGTVTIKLTERQEMAILEKDKQYVVIDGEGIVLQVVDQAPQLTLFSGVTVKDVKENEPLTVNEENAYNKAMKILQAMEKGDLFFKRIDVSQVVVSAYVTDTLLCRGKANNLIKSIEAGNLQAVLYDLVKKNVKKGVVNVGDDQYFSFSKKIK